jgi:hypothetical protein
METFIAIHVSEVSTGNVLRSSVLRMEANIPTLLALLICDYAIVEQQTQKKTLVGLFEDIHSPEVPFAQKLAIFARLTDLEGDYQFTMVLVRLTPEGEEIVARGGVQQLTVTDRLMNVDIALNLPITVFPAFGKYEFQFFSNESFLGRAVLHCHKMGGQQ